MRYVVLQVVGHGVAPLKRPSKRASITRGATPAAGLIYARIVAQAEDADNIAPDGARTHDSFSDAALALRERYQRVMDAPVDLEALAGAVRALTIRAFAGNADLVDAFLPQRRRLDHRDLRGERVDGHRRYRETVEFSMSWTKLE